jgi:hypothetical protein
LADLLDQRLLLLFDFLYERLLFLCRHYACDVLFCGWLLLLFRPETYLFAFFLQFGLSCRSTTFSLLHGLHGLSHVF